MKKSQTTRYYTLIASLVVSAIGAKHAWGFYVYPETSLGHSMCAKQGDSRDVYDDGTACAICGPRNNGDDNDAILQDAKDFCVDNACTKNSSSPIYKIGEVSDNGYTCYRTSNGTEPYWIKCDDETAFNGTFHNCCDPVRTSSTLTCSSYSTATCNAGYSGTFTGRSGDCKQQLTSKDQTVFNGTFKGCVGFTCSTSSYCYCQGGQTDAYCNTGYYGVFNGYSTDCKPCPTSSYRHTDTNTLVKGTSTYNNNSSILRCFISGSEGLMTDETGTFSIDGTCYY